MLLTLLAEEIAKDKKPSCGSNVCWAVLSDADDCRRALCSQPFSLRMSAPPLVIRNARPARFPTAIGDRAATISLQGQFVPDQGDARSEP